MYSKLSPSDYVVLTPQRIDVRAFKGNLDLTDERSPAMLSREQNTQVIGGFDVGELQSHYKGHLSAFDQVKLAGDDTLLVPKVIAAPMQAIANFHFSRDPEKYRTQAMFSDLKMYHIDGGHRAHASAPHFDTSASQFFNRHGMVQSYALFYTAVPADHYPGANTHLAPLIKDMAANGDPEDTEALMNELNRYTRITEPVTHAPGIIALHNDASAHRSGQTAEDCNRVWGAALLTGNNNMPFERTQDLMARRAVFGLD